MHLAQGLLPLCITKSLQMGANMESLKLNGTDRISALEIKTEVLSQIVNEHDDKIKNLDSKLDRLVTATNNISLSINTLLVESKNHSKTTEFLKYTVLTILGCAGGDIIIHLFSLLT